MSPVPLRTRRPILGGYLASLLAAALVVGLLTDSVGFGLLGAVGMMLVLFVVGSVLEAIVSFRRYPLRRRGSS